MIKEFTNPETSNYDLKVENTINSEKENSNIFSILLSDLIGVLEDDEYIKWGLTKEEYFRPNKNVIDKVLKIMKLKNIKPVDYSQFVEDYNKLNLLKKKGR